MNRGALAQLLMQGNKQPNALNYIPQDWRKGGWGGQPPPPPPAPTLPDEPGLPGENPFGGPSVSDPEQFGPPLPTPSPPPSLLDQLGPMGGQINPMTKVPSRFALPEREMLPQRRYGKGQLI